MSFLTTITHAQTFSSSIPVPFYEATCMSSGTIDSTAISVTGVGALGGSAYLREVCVTVKAPGFSNWVDDLSLILISPANDSVCLTIAGFAFPNSGDSLVMTCFAECPSLQTAETTTDVAPYTNSYRPNHSFALVNSMSADGDWRMMVCPDSTFSGELESWSLNFGPINPQVGIVQSVHPECPGDSTGSFEIPATSWCNPQSYSIDNGANYFPDSIFTDLGAGMYDICVLVDNGIYGLVSTCISTQTLLDDDLAPPMLACIDELVAQPQSGECEFTFIGQDFIVSLGDNCHVGLVEIDFLLGNGGMLGPIGPLDMIDLPLGLHNVTVTAYDSSGNFSTCMGTVQVFDVDPPIMTGDSMPFFATTNPGECVASFVVPYPTVEDSCTADVLMQIFISLADDSSVGPMNVTPGDSVEYDFPPGQSNIIYTALDTFGNFSQFFQTILVEDQEVPDISCPSDFMVNTSETSPGDCEALVSFPLPLITDNCQLDASVTVQIVYASGSIQNIIPVGDPVEESIPAGIATVTWIATDESGNTTSCMYLVTVVDDEAPLAFCGPDIFASTTGGVNPDDCFAEVSVGPAAAADNCSDVTFVSNVTLADGTTFSFPGNFETIDYFSFPVGTNSIEYVVIDTSGNMDSCTRFVFVSDDDPPEFVDCPVDLTLGTSSGPVPCIAETLLTSPDATDNCGIMEYTVLYELGDGTVIGPQSYNGGVSIYFQFPVGTNIITYEAIDSSEQSVQCVQTITVEDDEAPVWVDPSLQLEIVGTCNVDDADDLLLANFPLATDECTNPIYHEVSTVTTSTCGGGATTTIVKITVDDGANLSPDTFTVTILLEDTEPPVFTGIPQDDVSVSCQDAEFNLFVTAFDDCDGVIEVIVDVSTETFESCSLGDVLETTTYTYSATDSCGNQAIEVWTISVFNDLIVDLGNDVEICSGATTIIDAGIPDAEYLWSNGATTQQIEVGAGTYSVTVSTFGGCCEFDQIEIIEGLPPEAFALGGVLDCSNTPVMLTGSSSAPGAMYEWSGPGGFMSVQQNPEAVEAGVYILTVTDNGGCSSTASAEVTIDSTVPDASAVGDTISCSQPLAQLMAMSMTPGVTFSWTGPGNFVSALQNPVVDLPGTYTVVVSAPNSCVAVANAVVVDNTTAPDVSVAQGEVNCSTLEITLIGSSVTPDPIFTWSGPGGFSSNDPEINTAIPGMYILTVTGPNGCAASDTTTVLDNLTPVFALITTNLVEQPGQGEASVIVSGGSPPYVVQWDNGEMGTTAVSLTVGLHSVMVTDANGCARTFTFTMNRLRTVCDVQDELVASGDVVEFEFGSGFPVLPSLLQTPCVTEAFGVPLPPELELQTYLFYYQGSGTENILLSLDGLPQNDVRGFVFACDCAGMFCAQSCIGSFDSDIPYNFNDQPAGFYYIAILGVPGAFYELTIEDLNLTGPICFVDGTLLCNEMILDSLSGGDDYNTVVPGMNIYSDCYEGESRFDGPEFAYRLNLQEDSRVTFEAVSNARLGLFLYNYLCGRNCIAVAEGDGVNPVVGLTEDLSAGIYYLVIDQSDMVVGQQFSLIAHCEPLDDDEEVITPGAGNTGFVGFNVVACPQDSGAAHQIRFALTSSNINGAPMANGDRIFFVTPAGEVGGRKTGFKWGIGEDDFLYEDLQADSMLCGFNVGEQMAIYVKQKSTERTFPVTPVFAEPNGSTITARGNFTRQGLSLVTNLDTEPNATTLTLNVNPPLDLVKSTDRSTVIEVQTNQDWFITGTAQGFIDSISIVGGGTNVISGAGSRSVRVHFAENSTCVSRTDTIRVSANLSPAKLFILTQQGSNTSSDIDIMTIVNADGTASAMASGGSGDYIYLWSTGDSTSTTADSLANGVYAVTVTDGGGCTAVDSIDIMIVGVEQVQELDKLAVHPNPTTGLCYVTLPEGSDAVQLIVYDQLGTPLMERNVRKSPNRHEVIDLSHQPTGLYYIMCISAGKVYSGVVLRDK